MQLGLSTYTFPWAVGVPGFEPAKPISLLDLLDYASEKGIGKVQVGDNLPLHVLTFYELEKIKLKAADLKINLEVGTRRLVKEHILRYLKISQELQSPFLRVVIDDMGFHPLKEEVIKTITELLPHFKDAGIVLAIENHDRFSAKTLTEIIEETSLESVGICLDTANSLGANEGIDHIVEILAPYTVNLHIKDITINRVFHKMGFEVEGCAAGEGLLNIPEILSKLKHSGRCRTATLELWSSPLATIEETVSQERLWAEKSIAYLQHYIS